MNKRTIQQLRDYDELASLTSPFRYVDQRAELVNSISKVWELNAKDVEMIYKTIRVEDELREKRNKNYIEDATVKKLVECIKYFGIWISEEENCIKYLDWDATGVYGEHSSIVTLYKKGSFKCKSCKKQVPDGEWMCKDCKAKEIAQKFDPVI